MSNKSESRASQTQTAGTAIMEPDIVRDDLASHEDIAILAYFYWEARGYQGGSPEEDWLRAEQELSLR